MQTNNRLVTSLISLLLLVSAAAAQSYNVTDLGVLPRSTSVQAQGVNNAGQVVGFAPLAYPNVQAFLWSKSKGMQPLLLPPGFSNSAAYAINNYGDAVGQAAGQSGADHAILWRHNGSVIDLGIPKGSTYSTAYGINDGGEVLGWGNTAFLWTKKRGFRNLGSLMPNGTSVGWRVNQSNQAVGFSQSQSGLVRAFLWTDESGMIDLGLLPGGTFSEALGNNNFGQMVGDGDSGGGPNFTHAVLWQNGGVDIQDLGVLPGDNSSLAFAINDAGDVVGYSSLSSAHAILWTKDRGMLDLNTLIPQNSGWVLTEATFISGNGNSGYGTHKGETRAFLLTPR
jgi:probable HAF family extracellular repeat protein